MPTYARYGQPLGPREHEVLRLLGQGLRTRVIADRLCISVKTVYTHVFHIQQKLGLPASITATIAYAARQTYASPEQEEAPA